MNVKWNISYVQYSKPVFSQVTCYKYYILTSLCAVLNEASSSGLHCNITKLFFIGPFVPFDQQYLKYKAW